MKKFFIITSFLLFGTLIMSAQMRVGEWRSHYAYHNATQCIMMGDKIFVLSDGSLYSYSTTDEEIRTYNKSNILNDQGIQFLAKCKEKNLLCLIYNNANIDLLSCDESISNLPDFAESTSYDPTINDITISEHMAYLATTFGVVAINLDKEEFSNTYSLHTNVNSCATDGQHILAATPSGIYMGVLTTNLLDPTNWTLVSTEVYDKIVYFNQHFIALKKNQCIDILGSTYHPNSSMKGAYTSLHLNDDYLIAVKNDQCLILEESTDTPLSMDDAIVIHDIKNINDLIMRDEELYVAEGDQGLCCYTLQDDGTTTLMLDKLLPNSPMRNYCDYISFTDDERLLVAGGCLNYYGTTFYPGTAAYFQDDTWTTFQEEGIAQATGLTLGYNNVTSIVQDPLDPTHHYASSYGQGIYEFRNGEYVNNLNSSNSILETAVEGAPFYTRISRLKYDKNNNLWMTNSHALSPLKVLSKDGTITNLYYEELREQPTVTDILFDSNGLTWVVVMRADPGLFCIDDNNTPYDVKDDITRFISPAFVDQDGNSTTLDYIYDIAEDKDGIIWILTNQGPFVIEEPSTIFNSTFHFTKIKVPRNDGSNYADYLLDAVYTTCIAIDDANRKWIGTQSSGLYLLSADGYESIHHFTTDNSPLPSNNIKDLAICGSTGEVFIATDCGLVSYRSNATTPADEYTKEAVYAFPNPVSPDYSGDVTIVGLKANSSVKIINTAGHTIDAGTSLGGSYSWNACNAQGQRVATGVYFVLATDETNKEGIVTKIVVIN